MDGAYAIVKFPSSSEPSGDANIELDSLLQDCRLLRKDELQVSSYLQSLLCCVYRLLPHCKASMKLGSSVHAQEAKYPVSTL